MSEIIDLMAESSDSTRQKVFEFIDYVSNIELFEDPVARGLTEINEKIAEINNKNTKATRYKNTIEKALYEKNIAKEMLETAYDIEINRLMSEDIRVKSHKSKDERWSAAKTILLEKSNKIKELDYKVQELETFAKCLDNALANLKRAKEGLAKQIHIINVQMETGEISKSRFSLT